MGRIPKHTARVPQDVIIPKFDDIKDAEIWLDGYMTAASASLKASILTLDSTKDYFCKINNIKEGKRNGKN